MIGFLCNIAIMVAVVIGGNALLHRPDIVDNFPQPLQHWAQIYASHTPASLINIPSMSNAVQTIPDAANGKDKKPAYAKN